MSRGPSLNEVWRERQRALLAVQEDEPPATHARHGYDPNQPRVPAGNPDGGQWTDTGREAGTKLAAAEKLPLPWILRVALEVAVQAIKAYRAGRLLDEDDTVAVTTLDGEEVFGSNSTARGYSRVRDGYAARQMRKTLMRKYPDEMKRENIGWKPNDALFHAETTVLLRAARQNGGTLKGRTLEVYVDRTMCLSCRRVLPKVGVELGNPTVTFVGPRGQRVTMKDGKWLP